MATAGLSQAAITYVDATINGNTTLADGSALIDGTHYQSGTGGTNTWNDRAFANGGTIISNSDTTGEGDAPVLRTTISGLTAGESYEVYTYFWGIDGATTRGRTSLSSTTPMDGYNTSHFNGSSFDPMTALTRLVSGDSGLNPGPVSTADGSGFENGGYFTNSVLTEESNRSMYQVSLGTAVADGSGNIHIYIDDLENTSSVNRTWYDGVGYELAAVPEPGTSALLGMAGLGLILRRRR
ncbi:hypothetical protein Rhal01_01362 [Rubritalea halochordaticola]|uniref:Ice-binding protein C-terminal domain-containing protein n=2 Tax=Rubritalea halochordaticola TaxID=714537 RepID=A0ABP9V3H2_9BACT